MSSFTAPSAVPIADKRQLVEYLEAGCKPRADWRIGTCGKEGQWVPVGVGQPTLLIEGLTVGGTAA